MRIQLLSDLHLECHPNFVASPAQGADLLVLAGDIGSYQAGSSLLSSGDPFFGLKRFSPLNGWPTPVVLVPGNHEYDGLDFDVAHAQLQAACTALGIDLLERKSLVFAQHKVRVLGTTLWSDFDALAAKESTTTGMYRAREKAFRAANFYLRTMGGTWRGAPLLAAQVRELALESQAWLRAELALPFDGQTVVVTHFAPSLKSQDPRFPQGPGTAGFCNALDDLLPLAHVWMHGHLHCPSDYRVQGCRVVANPLGYAGKGEQNHFSDRFCVDVATKH